MYVCMYVCMYVYSVSTYTSTCTFLLRVRNFAVTSYLHTLALCQTMSCCFGRFVTNFPSQVHVL